MEWIREGEVTLPRTLGEPDTLRAWRPWVLEEADGALRMWYSGSDGTTSRILAAERPPGGVWEPLGIAIDAGFAGDSDSYGAESPCLVKTPGGYLMVYGGFDGEASRLHMATSDDSRRWDPQGTIMQRGPEDAGGANHPCLLITGERWWLFFTGYPGSSGALDSPEPVVTDLARGSRQAALRPALSRLLTVQEVADLLQVPPKTIYAWRYKGLGPTAVPVGKYLRFRPEDVAAWLEARADLDRSETGQLVNRGGSRRPRTARHHDEVSSTPSNSRHIHLGKSPSS